MTTRDDIVGGGNPSDGLSRRTPVSRSRVRTRKTGRTRTLISGMLKRHGSVPRTVMVCKSCELTGGPFSPAEAAHLLAVHEQLHHGGLSMHRPPLPPPA